jgi:hypothetical protein
MQSGKQNSQTSLSALQIKQFIKDGLVRIDQAFPKELAEQALDELWRNTGCDRDNPNTWTHPVIRLMPIDDQFGNQPLSFREAANTPILYRAFDQLLGNGRWQKRPNVGTFVVRFPGSEDPGDLGWHIDASFQADEKDNVLGDYSDWRVNITSRGRALLMLFLFSDVGEQDAPTRIRVGSHQDMARFLAPAGDIGMSNMELESVGADRPVAFATGKAGTVYLCHPFLIHAAQRHNGSKPRFMSQPPLGHAEPFKLEREDGDYSPAEIAIREALNML